MATENSKAKPRGKPFPKGVSGNAGGRPKSTLSKTLEKVLAKKYADKITNEEALCDAIVSDAIKGDKEMRNLIWDRREGKVTQPMSLGDPDGNAIRFTLGLGDGKGQ